MTDCLPDAPLITLGLTAVDPLDPITVWPARSYLPSDGTGDGVWWNQMTLPDFPYRYEYAPTSRWLPGQVLLGAVPDLSTLSVALVAQGTTLDALEAQRSALAAVLAQWSYTAFVTAHFAGDPADPTSLGSWTAKPARPVWGPVTPGLYGLLVCPGAVTINVNPEGAD